MISIVISGTWNLKTSYVLNQVLKIICWGCSFATAAAMLCGLLLYDVFWVFGSSHVFGDNVMVTVSDLLILFSCFLDLSQVLNFDCMHVFASFELQFSQKSRLVTRFQNLDLSARKWSLM
jgi:hypothetical protein